MEPSSPPGLSALEGNGRTPTVKNVGEPCAGKPHARFDREGLETEPRPPRQPLTLPPSTDIETLCCACFQRTGAVNLVVMFHYVGYVTWVGVAAHAGVACTQQHFDDWFG